MKSEYNPEEALEKLRGKVRDLAEALPSADNNIFYWNYLGIQDTANIIIEASVDRENFDKVRPEVTKVVAEAYAIFEVRKRSYAALKHQEPSLERSMS
jgi:hypothetical protein